MSDSVAVVDCDTHFWQPLEEWEPYIDPARRDVVVEYVAASDPMPKLDVAVREKLLADMAQIRGGDHARERLQWMDDEGIAVNVIYPGWLHASAPEHCQLAGPLPSASQLQQQPFPTSRP